MAWTCDPDTDRCAYVLVRGTQIEFISVEQADRVGCSERACPPKLNEKLMPSDIRTPPPYVLIHDTVGEIFDPCHFYVVRWYGSGGGRAMDVSGRALADARMYFGRSSFRTGRVEVPRGPWEPRAWVRLIRYERPGHPRAYEHLYQVPVMLYRCRRPLAWRLELPQGCVVNDHGFVRP
jgi:hypothetical protein